MAWNRQIELVLRSQVALEAGVYSWKDTPLTGLDMEFDITRSIIFNDNLGSITVYNAPERIRNQFTLPGNNVLLSAGYSDSGTGLIYQGTILRAQSAKNGPDWVTSLRCASMRSKDKPFQTTPVAFSFAKGTPMSTVLDAIAQQLGLVLVGVSADWPLANGWSYVGAVRGALTYCEQVLRANNMALFIDLAEMVVYTKGAPSKFTALYLDYTCGLLEVKDDTDTTDLAQETVQAVLNDGSYIDVDAAIADNTRLIPKRYTLETLLIPHARPNGIVQLKSDKATGLFMIETVNFKVDTFGGAFNCTMEVSAE